MPYGKPANKILAAENLRWSSRRLTVKLNTFAEILRWRVMDLAVSGRYLKDSTK